jgi:hypothetical protein
MSEARPEAIATARQQARWDAAIADFLNGNDREFVDYEQLAVELDLPSRRPSERR